VRAIRISQWGGPEVLELVDALVDANVNLMRHSSAVIGFWLAHCFARPEEMLAAPLRDLFERVESGDLRVVEGPVYPLSEARRAHEDLQARRTTGKLLLDPAS
jgi:NADPH2:quinone reductase